MAFSKFVKFTAKVIETGEILQEKDYVSGEIIDKVFSNKTQRIRFDNLNYVFDASNLKAGDKVYYAVRDELTGIAKEVPLEVVEVKEVKTMKF